MDCRSVSDTLWSLTNTESYEVVCYMSYMVDSLVIAWLYINYSDCKGSQVIDNNDDINDNSKVICKLHYVCRRQMSNTNTPMNDERLIPCLSIRVEFSKSAAPLRGRTVDLSVPLCDSSFGELSWRVTAECSTYWANRADQVVLRSVH